MRSDRTATKRRETPESEVETEVETEVAVEYVFEANITSLPDLRQYARAMVERRAFMVELAKSDLKGARSNDALGQVWMVLDPVLQIALYYFVYAVIRSGQGGRSLDHLPVLIGDVFLFSLVTAAMGQAGNSIRNGSQLMLNSSFPRALLPLSSVLKSVLAFKPRAAVFAVMFVAVGGKLGMGIFVLPLLFTVELAMVIGIALFTATVVTLHIDAGNLIGYISRLLLLASPIIYPVVSLSATARQFIGWQPLFALFASYQAVFTGDVPDPMLVLQSAVWAAFLLVGGAVLFLRYERDFASHI